MAHTPVVGLPEDYAEVCSVATEANEGKGKSIYSDVWLWVAVATIVACACLPRCLAKVGFEPPVGMYIAILGALAVAVTLRKEPSLPEKACWIVAITLLMLWEVNNLYVEANRQRIESSKISASLMPAIRA